MDALNCLSSLRWDFIFCDEIVGGNLVMVTKTKQLKED
jgi:hypothetical protein